MGHLLFQLSLTLWNSKTNHIILSVPVKIRHDRGCLVNKKECKGSSKLKRILHSNLMNYRSVANAMIQLNMVLGQ